MLLIWRYFHRPLAALASGRLTRSAFSLHSVAGSSATEPAPVMYGSPAGIVAGLSAGAGDVSREIWNLQSAEANASAFRVFVPSVFRSISSENELLSSCVRRFRPGVRFR